jgi:hypothetical protein
MAQALAEPAALDFDPIRVIRIKVYLFCLSMILSENRLPPRITSGAGLFGIML